MLRLWADESFGFRTLFDARKGDLSQAAASSIRSTAASLEKNRSKHPHGRGAYLVSRDVDFGVARMAEALAEMLPVEARTFKDRDAALIWLSEGLDGPT
jgi:hypothetical protein